jgi:hypothetical protein
MVPDAKLGLCSYRTPALTGLQSAEADFRSAKAGQQWACPGASIRRFRKWMARIKRAMTLVGKKRQKAGMAMTNP